jgi:organic hydroperoxide reductase OsmC/OhrA
MEYSARILWQKKPEQVFTDNKYSRSHKWFFDGDIELSASSSPQVVPVPMSEEMAVDPEEALVASVSSCHMLFFLSIAASNHYIVKSYEDIAVGIVSKNKDGIMAMDLITLNPKVNFTGATIPSKEQIDALHQLAHEKCYIANSLKSEIKIISL